MTATTYLNGQYVPAETAQIRIDQRLVRFGDGVFETIRVRGSELPQLARHYRRLEGGLTALRIPCPPLEEITEISRQLIAQNATTEAVLRLSISRGAGSRGYLPTMPANQKPLIIGEILPLPEPSSAPLNLWLSAWQKPSITALPVTFKLAQGVNSTLARMEAADHHADEALMLNDRGEICEASGANLFWQQGDALFTPALECGLLAGIAREQLLEAWPHVIQGRFTLEALKEADSVILCNSIRGALPVTTLRPQGWNWHSQPLANAANQILQP